MRIRDWSSDVCSSDLVAARVGVGNRLAVVHLLRRQPGKVPAPGVGLEQDVVAQHVELLLRLALDVDVRTAVAALGVTEHAARDAPARSGRTTALQIGRASCGERGRQYV